MSQKVDVQILHHRASLGETLSEEEQTKLEQWYAQQDAEESKMLAANAAANALLSSEHLRQQIDDSLAQIQATAERIRLRSAENAALRCELDMLKQRLAQKVHPSAV